MLEYVAALVEDKRIEWRVLVDGSYRLMTPGQDGIYRSKVFPGLWLDEAAFWRGDDLGLPKVLEQGLATEAHAKFVELLKSRRAQPTEGPSDCDAQH